MSRGARAHSRSGLYHVILRGVNQQDIFDDATDRQIFLTMLQEVMWDEVPEGSPRRRLMSVYAWVLMTNHVHLLCREYLTAEERERLKVFENERIGISAVMHRLGRKYSMYYNVKYGRMGPLFQDRFKSECVEDEDYFLRCMRYIHYNPVKAGICERIDGYHWTSWHEYLTPQPVMICAVESVLHSVTRDQILFLHEEPPEDDEPFIDIEDRMPPLTDDQVKALMMDRCGCATPADVQRLSPDEQRALAWHLISEGAMWKQSARMCGLTVGQIRHWAKRRDLL